MHLFVDFATFHVSGGDVNDAGVRSGEWSGGNRMVGHACVRTAVPTAHS